MKESEDATVPSRIYRFRPLTVVKPGCDSGVFIPAKTVVEELDSQEIYLAPLDELNDPMDGLHHLVWDGDPVLWGNWLRSYARCLLDALLYVHVAGDTASFDSSAIHPLATPGDSPTPAYRALLDDLAVRLQQNPSLQTLLDELCRRGRLRRQELLAMLSLHQMQFLREVVGVLQTHGFDDVIPGLPDDSGHVDLRSLAEVLPALDDRKLGVAGDLGGWLNEQQYLIHRYNARASHSPGRDNLVRLITLFPQTYIRAVEEAIYGEHYVTSFSRNPGDPSMWAHYAEQHKGICLIFEPVFQEKCGMIETDEGQRLILDPVLYGDVPPEINFFESLGRLPYPELEAGWLTWNGERSRLASIYDDSYPEGYWSRFRQKTRFKLSAWTHEEEVRVVQDSLFRGRLKSESRILRYSFEQLVGIIFGMRTPVEEELRIIDVVDRKLQKHSDRKFEFHKASYSPTQSRFEILALTLLELQRGLPDSS